MSKVVTVDLKEYSEQEDLLDSLHLSYKAFMDTSQWDRYSPEDIDRHYISFYQEANEYKTKYGIDLLDENIDHAITRSLTMIYSHCAQTCLQKLSAASVARDVHVVDLIANHANEFFNRTPTDLKPCPHKEFTKQLEQARIHCHVTFAQQLSQELKSKHHDMVTQQFMSHNIFAHYESAGQYPPALNTDQNLDLWAT